MLVRLRVRYFCQLPQPLLPFGWVCNFELIPAPFVLHAPPCYPYLWYPCSSPHDSTPLEWHRSTTAGTAVVLKYCSISRFMRCPSNDASPRLVQFPSVALSFFFFFFLFFAALSLSLMKIYYGSTLITI